VTRCAFCDSIKLHEVMDFGHVALAGGFLRPEEFISEKRYRMRLSFCADCFAVQIIDKVSASVLFHADYFYFSSAIRTLADHFAQYAVDVTRRFLPEPAKAKVLEVGCNDGVLVRPLADQAIGTVIGVDPATNVVKTIDDRRVTLINNFFSERVAKEVVERHGKMDLVMANNVYAHIPDIQGVTRAVRDVLADDGVFIFEVHYLGKVINEMQYDMIYHEHLYYYSLLSAIEHFRRYDMVVFDVQMVPIHAGSIRFHVSKRTSRHASAVSDAVRNLEREERRQGFDRPETYTRFASDVASAKRDLMSLLERLRAEGRTVAGYGASGRANTIIQYCGIGHEHMQYMIDDAPAKLGYYTPGSHFEIKPSVALLGPDAPDYVLVFAWSFLDEIARKNQHYRNNGGRMIVPLPEVKIC
jgi:methylation protein EvaC